MRLLLLIMSCYAIADSDGYLYRRETYPDWNNLRVTWYPFPIGTYVYTSMPRTVNKAIAGGFTMVSDCGDIPGINGKRFVKEGDFALVLLYGVNGFIAGIQIGVPYNESDAFPPHNQINQTFIRIGDMYFLTAYFTNPAITCKYGRTRHQFDFEGTGSALYIQNGTDADTNFLEIPMREPELASTKWTRGHCFFSMGVHYWYNINANMSCDDFFPVFLLYNRGWLNGFGWAIGTDISSPRMEHYAYDDIVSTMDPIPNCLHEIQRLSTMHIYFTNPLLNFC
ncbi:uncharacterized protein LOC117339372 [Pecten maximus]|uniref:uncharacterized protein LOC117339372 n=1 Tax=Pecten maximus TaxID=6579 RepID=UPI0014580E01|nr:uncharacterized protein LOC117339372 [Pecten maximus]